jgi:hypothetical protein
MVSKAPLDPMKGKDSRAFYPVAHNGPVADSSPGRPDTLTFELHMANAKLRRFTWLQL